MPGVFSTTLVIYPFMSFHVFVTSESRQQIVWFGVNQVIPVVVPSLGPPEERAILVKEGEQEQLDGTGVGGVPQYHQIHAMFCKRW